MPLFRKPHALIFWDAQEVYDGQNAVIDTSRAPGQTVRGQLTPMGARTLEEQWGLALQRPHLWLCNLSDDGKFKEGDYATYNGREFTVKGIKRWGALANLDHLECLLEEHTNGAL